MYLLYVHKPITGITVCSWSSRIVSAVNTEITAQNSNNVRDTTGQGNLCDNGMQPLEHAINFSAGTDAPAAMSAAQCYPIVHIWAACC